MIVERTRPKSGEWDWNEVGTRGFPRAVVIQPTRETSGKLILRYVFALDSIAEHSDDKVPRIGDVDFG